MKKPMDELRTVQQIPISYVGKEPEGPGSPQMKMSVVANLAIVQWTFAKAGDRATSHIHPFDHQTLIAKGRVRIHVTGFGLEQITAAEYGEGEIVVVRKMIEHQFEALTDGAVFYCIHAFRKSDLEDDIVGPEESPEAIAPLSLGAA